LKIHTGRGLTDHAECQPPFLDKPELSQFLLFLTIFVGILAIGGILYLFAQLFYKFYKWIERKTGSSELAYGGTPLVLFALFYAAYGTWLVSVVEKRARSAQSSVGKSQEFRS
jgi:hypothetical protein